MDRGCRAALRRLVPCLDIRRKDGIMIKAERLETEEGKQERRRREGIIKAGKQKERDEKTAFWTTPGFRPLAEPPFLDWEQFARWYIPSDLRYKTLFPSDPEKRAAVKDLDGELGVLIEYFNHAQAMRNDLEIDNERVAFYENLLHYIQEDWREVEKEVDELWATATTLSRFEFSYLDNDGKTKVLEEWINCGANIFFAEDYEIKQKYQHLVPPNFVENSLATFEFRYLTLNGSTGIIQMHMDKGRDILAGWPQEVQDKYGYLRTRLPASEDSGDDESSVADSDDRDSSEGEEKESEAASDTHRALADDDEIDNNQSPDSEDELSFVSNEFVDALEAFGS